MINQFTPSLWLKISQSAEINNGQISIKSKFCILWLYRLELEGHYEKATAIALFHASITDALMILNSGAEDGEYY